MVNWRWNITKRQRLVERVWMRRILGLRGCLLDGAMVNYSLVSPMRLLLWNLNILCGIYVIHDQNLERTCRSPGCSKCPLFMCSKQGVPLSLNDQFRSRFSEKRPFEGGKPPWWFSWLFITTCHLWLILF